MEQKVNTIFNDEFFFSLSRDMKELKNNNNTMVDLIKTLESKVSSQEKKIIELTDYNSTLINKINELSFKNNQSLSPIPAVSPSVTYYRPIINITSDSSELRSNLPLHSLPSVSTLSPRVSLPKVSQPILPNLPNLPTPKFKTYEQIDRETSHTIEDSELENFSTEESSHNLPFLERKEIRYHSVLSPKPVEFPLDSQASPPINNKPVAGVYRRSNTGYYNSPLPSVSTQNILRDNHLTRERNYMNHTPNQRIYPNDRFPDYSSRN